ncbi:hypothetical protein [Candidatus Carsonella ruddii]|uniref:hypothetical protein n=1 Tax=Carsonella ruddii TaxID=114186 RepID=UPI003D9A8DA1
MNKNLKKKINNLNFIKNIFQFIFIYKKKKLKIFKKKFNLKKINIFYKKKNFLNNKNNIFLIIFLFNKNKNFFLIKNILNFKKKFFLNNEYYSFFKKINNLIILLKKNFFIFKNFKINKNKKKRFINFKNTNKEIPQIKFLNYYSFLNLFLINKNSKYIILMKNSSFNKIKFYNNILILKNI